MKKKFFLTLIIVTVFILSLAGGAFAAQGTDDLLAAKWERGQTAVGLLQKAGTPGYDFVLIYGNNHRIFLVPASPGVTAKLTANLNSKVRVRGKFLPEKFSRRGVMEVTDVLTIGQREFVDLPKEQTEDDQSVSDNVYGSPVQPPQQTWEPGDFTDIAPGHWAAKAIKEMAKRKIISGMGDNRFVPDAMVTRAQFATMLVNALGLPVTEPTTQTFVDVGPQDWSYKYVEAAKSYLTGYKTASGTVMFQPHIPAVREDMAVAIVDARGISPATDLTVLNSLRDSQNISPNLKPYVAAAISAGLMKGYEDGTFRPQGKLTRAEAAALLYKVMLGDKIVM